MKLDMYGNSVIENRIETYILERISSYPNLEPDKKKILVEKLIRGCKNCRLRYENNYSNIPPVIQPGCKSIFIGRSPCLTEAQNNEMFPLGTNVGNLFDRYLSVLDLSRSNISLLNMVYCYTRNNRPPEQECINVCVSFKKFEMDIVGDSFNSIFLMGNDAKRWLFGLRSPGVLKTMGEFYEITIKGRRIVAIPIVHPSHLLIQPELKDDVIRVLKKAKELINKV